MDMRRISNNTKPGSFRDIPEEDIRPHMVERIWSPGKLESNDRNIAMLKLFIDMFEPDRAQVLYPGCGFDESPGKVFGKKYVLHVDINAQCIDALYTSDYRAKKVSIDQLNVIAKPFDILLLFNFWSVESLEMLKIGGYLICNNWHSQADELLVMHQNRFGYMGFIEDDGNSICFHRFAQDKKKKFFIRPPTIIQFRKLNATKHELILRGGSGSYHIFKKFAV
jgi:hypothetical protein